MRKYKPKLPPTPMEKEAKRAEDERKKQEKMRLELNGQACAIAWLDTVKDWRHKRLAVSRYLLSHRAFLREETVLAANLTMFVKKPIYKEDIFAMAFTNKALEVAHAVKPVN